MPYAVAVVQPSGDQIVVIVVDAASPAAAIDAAKARGFEIADDTARPVIGTGARLASPPITPYDPAPAVGSRLQRDNPSWWTIARGVYVGMLLVAATYLVILLALSCILTGSLLSGLKSVPTPTPGPRGASSGR